MTMSLNFL